MVLRVLQFNYCLVYKVLELLLPTIVKLVKTLVSLDAIVYYTCDEVLSRFCVFLSHHSSTLCCLLPIFLWLLILCGAIRMRTENCWRWKNLVEMLELLSGTLLVSINNSFIINTGHIWEPIDNKSTKKCGVWNFIFLDAYWSQCRQCL